MNTKTLSQDQDLVIKCKEITSHFENQIADLAISAQRLSAEDKDKIATELKATIQNINFVINSSFAVEIVKKK